MLSKYLLRLLERLKEWQLRITLTVGWKSSNGDR